MAVTNYLWDEDSYLEEYDETGATTAAYTNEPTPFGSIISQYKNSETNYYHYNSQGSTHQLTDDNETVTDTFSYDAWGNEIARTGMTPTPFRYIGEVGYYYDEELGSYYVRARAYQPTTGRWISTDPIGLVEGSNLYLAYFVPNSVDPSGLWTQIAPPRGNIYKADKDNESLMELAQIVTGDVEDWVCIWPKPDTLKWKDYPKAKCGALADVSNLKYKTRRLVKMRQDFISRPKPNNDGFMEAVSKIWGRSGVWTSGANASKYLANKSGQGKTPISQLLIGGHNYGAKAEIGNNPGGPIWKASDIINIATEPDNSKNTYGSAIKKIGPPRCWFAREAKIYGFACNTHPAWTNDWASKVVRKSAIVHGAIPLVYAQFDTKGPRGSVKTSYTQFAGKQRRNYTLKRLLNDPSWEAVSGSQ